jgi:hypothetical protein
MEKVHKAGAIGVPGFDWEFQIVDDQSRPVAQGKRGPLGPDRLAVIWHIR